jgi:hypothetical protein
VSDPLERKLCRQLRKVFSQWAVKAADPTWRSARKCPIAERNLHFLFAVFTNAEESKKK